jgi:peptidyl-prolyl cis-trans isomerase A (cyclophilin A)
VASPIKRDTNAAVRIFLASLLLLIALPASAQSLADPSTATLSAPDIYKVRFETTSGDFTLKVNRDWAPAGADRFYNLIELGFYDDTAFYRVLRNFIVQFGLHARPDISYRWKSAMIQDDAVWKSNRRRWVSFAKSGPNTRTTQIFINYANNRKLDDQGFAPFGRVVTGMKVVDALYNDYGEGRPRGMGPDQSRIMVEGSKYLRDNYPRLDWVERAYILP